MGRAVTKPTVDLDTGRLLELSEEVSRIASALASLSERGLNLEQTRSTEKAGVPEVAADVVYWIIRARRERARYFANELFADPAWDMMLDLFHAELTHQRVSVSSLCIAAGVPATTALRWLKTLVDEGVCTRQPDERDNRRIYVELVPEVSNAFRRYFAQTIETAPFRNASPIADLLTDPPPGEAGNGHQAKR